MKQPGAVVLLRATRLGDVGEWIWSRESGWQGKTGRKKRKELEIEDRAGLVAVVGEVDLKDTIPAPSESLPPEQ